MAIVEPLEKAAPDLPQEYLLRSPATGEDIGSFRVTAPEEVLAAVARARDAQLEWAALGFDERTERLGRLRRVLIERMDEVAAVITRETGKPEIEAVAEIIASLDALVYYPKHARRMLREQRRTPHLFMPFKQLVKTYHPRGVIGIITPWNFPFSMGMNPAAQALMAGNAVLLKPSEVTPFSGMKIAELVREANLPPYLFQVLPGDGTTGEALIRSGVDKIHFTGSVRTGRKVGALCGELLVPSTLELGGKDAAIVCADADLERAVGGVVNGAFFNTGQACASTERVYVVDSVADAFQSALLAEVAQLRQGDPHESDLGCMIWDRQLDIVEAQVRDAVRDGATVLAGGDRLQGAAGLYYQPTVLADVSHDMRIMREETFGPVLPIVRVADEEEAIRLANDSDYGLSASIWCGDHRRGLDIARRLHTGCAAVNDFGGLTYGAAEGSFGGRRASGIGYVNGELGLKSFCQAQHVVVHRFGPKRERAWYPYSSKTLEGMKGFARFFFNSAIGRWLS
ncbi:MAG: aldehyde dehydrogenase family protein [Halioglobus sp.]|nr:aldehyde dehydrogenase family protein [Halioglobus sp.]